MQVFPHLADLIGKGGLFFAAAAASFIGMIVTYIIVPRTKNKSLSELENLFTSPTPGQVAKDVELGESTADSGIVEDIVEMKTKVAHLSREELDQGEQEMMEMGDMDLEGGQGEKMEEIVRSPGSPKTYCASVASRKLKCAAM